MLEAISLLGITVPAVATGVWAVIKFVNESRKNREQRQLALDQSVRELAWQRTKFLFELTEKFNKDEGMRAATRAMVYPQVMAGAETTALERVLRLPPEPYPPELLHLGGDQCERELRPPIKFS